MLKDLGLLQELGRLSEYFQKQGDLPPTAYKNKHLNWVIEIDQFNNANVQGPFKPGETRKIYMPDRYRAGKVSSTNLKPYLLADKATYALGIPEEGKESEAKLLHDSYIKLLKEAYERTEEADIQRIINFLKHNKSNTNFKNIKPGDFISFRYSSEDFPFERKFVQDFWSQYLSEELVTDTETVCSICIQEKPILKTLPRPIVIMGQKCQVTSFNLSAFYSFGRKQTTVFPICYSCASKAIDGLDYLIQIPQHHKQLARDDSKAGTKNSLRNQLAVFWIKEPQTQELSVDDQLLNSEAEEDIFSLSNLTAIISNTVLENENDPPAELSQLEEFLKIPWNAKETTRYVSETGFCLAVLSANKGRLVVRDWITTTLLDLKQHLAQFVDALRIVSPHGEPARAFGIPVLIGALAGNETYSPKDSNTGNESKRQVMGLEKGDAKLIRGLLRTAYKGQPPPQALLEAALRQFRNPKLHKHDPKRYEQIKKDQTLHILAATLKLSLTYGNPSDANAMTQVDPKRNQSAYQCGRLLAVVEEAQKRASGWNINVTLTDRFYAAASTAPAAYLSILHKRAMSSHIPQVRRKNKGAKQLETLLLDIMKRVDDLGGFPPILMPKDQAEFALGFYSQKAEFAKPPKAADQNQESTSSQSELANEGEQP